MGFLKYLKDMKANMLIAEREKEIKILLTELEASSNIETVKIETVKSLGKMGNIHTVDPLVNAFINELRNTGKSIDQDYSYQDAIEEALVEISNRIGKEAIARLISVVSKNYQFQQILYKLDKGIMTPLLVNALQNNNFEVSKGVASVLDMIGWRATNTQDEINYLIAAEKKDELIKIGKAAVVPLNNSIERIISSESYIDWAADTIAEIGDPDSVKPLMDAMEKSNESWNKRGIARALLEIGDEKVLNHIVNKVKKGELSCWDLVDTFKKINWIPGNDIDQAYYFIWQEKWDELIEFGKRSSEEVFEVILLACNNIDVLTKIGKHIVPYLIKKLKNHTFQEKKLYKSSVYFSDEGWDDVGIAFILGEIGDKRAAEVVIDYLFEQPDFMGSYINWKNTDWVATNPFSVYCPLKNLFEDYTELIIKTSCYGEWELSYEGDDIFCRTINYFEGHEAIRMLNKIHTDISNNILHKICQRKEFKKVRGEMKRKNTIFKSIPDRELDIKTEKEHFEYQKILAIQELKKRRDRPYEPSVYLEKEVWGFNGSKL